MEVCPSNCPTLAGPQSAVGVRELRLELDSARGLIDRVIDQLQLAFGGLPPIVRCVGLNFQRAARYGLGDAIDIIFRKREDHVDGLMHFETCEPRPAPAVSWRSTTAGRRYS